jgi:hypothetical protein
MRSWREVVFFDSRDGRLECARGGHPSFEEFFDAEHERLLRALYLVTGDGEEAQDLMRGDGTPSDPWAITGGNGVYRNARGQILKQELSSNTKVTFELIP